ncbi:MAG: regulatory protein GemA [Rhodospirillaceae bacterium]|nr:regulatory protein GemA [Rhodospirillales bacterium]
MQRNKLIAKIKVGAKNIRLVDDDYRDFLALHGGGKRSCKDMTDDQLKKVAAALDTKGAYPDVNQGGTGDDRPTDAQRRKLAALARDRDWDGLTDDRLIAFVKRTTGVEAMRFLTRAAMSDVITGLERWNGGAS